MTQEKIRGYAGFIKGIPTLMSIRHNEEDCWSYLVTATITNKDKLIEMGWEVKPVIIKEDD